MRLLGLSAFYHDSASVLIDDGRIIAAAQEGRFSRKKFDAGFPEHAIAYCLAEARCGLHDLDAVVFYEKPLRKFQRLAETYLAFAPKGFKSYAAAMPVWLTDRLFQKRSLERALARLAGHKKWRGELLFSEHHLSHAASAFFPSPFESAAVLTLDGVGEWATASLSLGSGNRLEIQQEMRFPHSLGLLYSAFTYYTGFAVDSDEYKVMGLAPYGEPRYLPLILDKLIDLKDDGSFRLDQSYFDYCTGIAMTNQRFADLFSAPVRKPETPLTQFHMDIAASVQAVCEEVVLRLCRSIRKSTGARNVCLAGGVALNCVANGKVLREGIFDDLWIQPAAGDAGGALGAALAGYHLFRGAARPVNGKDAMQGALLGPAFDQRRIHADLAGYGAVYHDRDDRALLDEVVSALTDGKVVGWFQGRMEFGPRALGARSILGDPRSPTMQRILNLKIKYRESFRPFAPAVLREDVADWFELDGDSPYMLLVAGVRRDRRRAMTAEEQRLFGIDKLNIVRSDLPAVTHIDYSARIQTVDAETNPRFYALISAFKARTGVPVLVNTSFNRRDEPIVCTPAEAFRCFMGTEMDLLVLGNTVLRKEEQRRRPSSVRSLRQDALVPAEILACLKPPGSGAAATLERADSGFRCPETGTVFPDREGVPSLLGESRAGAGIRERVGAIPSYEGAHDFGSLVIRGLKSEFARSLLAAVGYNKLILECGCGTGQLSHFLSLNNNCVLGVDLPLASLQLALQHKLQNELGRLAFCQMDIFDLAIRDESFDVVVSSGVLHHTKDARQAFAAIVRKAKPGGLVVFGLDDRWVRDQSLNRRETRHAINEVMEWFRENGVEYLNGQPPIFGIDAAPRHALSAKTAARTRFARIATRVSSLGAIAREGAPFVLTGRRRAA